MESVNDTNFDPTGASVQGGKPTSCPSPLLNDGIANATITLQHEGKTGEYYPTKPNSCGTCYTMHVYPKNNVFLQLFDLNMTFFVN